MMMLSNFSLLQYFDTCSTFAKKQKHPINLLSVIMIRIIGRNGAMTWTSDYLSQHFFLAFLCANVLHLSENQ